MSSGQEGAAEPRFAGALALCGVAQVSAAAEVGAIDFAAAALLFERLGGGDVATQHIVMKATLKARDSAAAPVRE